jgi:hypothetical protein
VSTAAASRFGWYVRRTASSIVGALAGIGRQIGGTPAHRPSRFPGAGITLLRTSGRNEIWCRCDCGSHGTIGLAAGAHAEALSVEVRYAGVDILVGPGTLCYPVRHAHTREIEVLDDGDIASWTAEHEGDASLDPPALHRRSVLLDRASRSIDIIDQIDGGSHDIRLAFHLGPDVQAELKELSAVLGWPTASTPGAARLELPPGLRWSLHQDDTNPILRRYFPGWGRHVPAITLLGCGRCVPGMPLIARLEFLDICKSGKSAVSRQAILWTPSAALSDREPEIQAEAR